MPTRAYRTKSLTMAPSRNAIICHVNRMSPCCILSANNIVKLTAPVVARRVPEVPVPFFLWKDPVVCDALAVFDEQPDANNKEVVPKQPGALQHVLIDDVNSLTPKSVPAGTKLVLFGRYVLNIYVGIVRYFLRTTKLSTPKSTYRHNAQIGEYRTILTSTKKIRFWPSTHVID